MARTKAKTAIARALATWALLAALLTACTSPDPVPPSPAAIKQLQQARQATQNQRYDEALKYYQHTIELAPQLPAAHFERGNILARLGHPGAAASAYESALAADSTHFESRHNLAVIRADQGDLPTAISLLQRLTDYLPALETLSLFYAKQGLYSQSAAALKRALRAAPEAASLHQQLGAHYLRQGRHDEAAASLEKALHLDSTQVQSRRLLALLYLQKRQLDLAIEHLGRVLAEAPLHIEAHYNMATALAARGKRDEAQHYMHRFETLAARAARIAQLRRLLDSAPDDAAVRLELAQHYTEIDQVARALFHYRAVLLSDSLHLQSLVRLSSLLARSNQWREALLLCQRGIEYHGPSPQKGSLFFTAGYIHLAQKNYGEAERYFSHALELNPNHAGAWNNLGNLQQQRGDLTAARRSFSEAIRADSTLVNAHFNLGTTSQLQGHLEQARHSLRKALQLDPSFARAYYGLASVYEASDSLSAARRAYGQFLDNWQGDKSWRERARARLQYLSRQN